MTCLRQLRPLWGALWLLVLMGSPAQVLAYSVGSGFGNECHERISVRAFELLLEELNKQFSRLEIPDDPVLQALMGEMEKAMLAQGRVYSPEELFLMVSLVVGVRAPDTDGHSIANLESLRRIHGDPSDEAQYAHCLRGIGDDFAEGDERALEGTRQVIRDLVALSLPGSELGDNPLLTAHIYLDFYGRVEVPVLARAYYHGNALHVVQDCFAHALRMEQDGFHTMATLFNYIDAISPGFDENRDGLAHSDSMDDCLAPEAQALTEAAIQASLDFSRSTLEFENGDDIALESFFERWMSLETGCNKANQFCDNDALLAFVRLEQTQPYMDEILDCDAGVGLSTHGRNRLGLLLVWAITLGLVLGVRRFRRALPPLLLLLVFQPVVAIAGEREPQRPAEIVVQRSVEVPLLLLGGLFWAMPLALDEELMAPGCTPPCDPVQVNSLDRWAMGEPSGALATASDVLAGVLPAGLLAWRLASTRNSGWRATMDDLIIVGESVILSGITHQLARHAFHRSRPYMYSDQYATAGTGTVDDGQSFYSGHTSSAFAAAVSFSLLHNYRNPKSGTTWAWWTVGLGLATGMAALRVASQDHFITDVVAGAALGSAWGILVPWLHVRASRGQIALQPLFSTDFAGLSVAF